MLIKPIPQADACGFWFCRLSGFIALISGHTRRAVIWYRINNLSVFFDIFRLMVLSKETSFFWKVEIID